MTRQGACATSSRKSASTRSRECRSHDRASGQVRPLSYDAFVGGSRFLQTDPIEGGSANDYDYTAGDPINATDLNGLCNSPEVWCVIGILKGTESLPDGFAVFLRGRGGRVVGDDTKAGFRRMRSDGGCSAPRSSAFNLNFTNACKTHDLGYDLMRFFKSSGFLGSTRFAVDALFLNDMRADCRGRGWFGLLEGSCRGVAGVYYGAVTANSAYQRYGVP